MITSTAFAIFVYCLAVIAVTVVIGVLGRRRATLRRSVLRIVLVFAVFLCASAYVWLDLGPEVDQRLKASHAPLAPPVTPRQIDV